MKQTFMVLLVFLLVPLGAGAGEWRTSVALSYVSGFSDIVDISEDNLNAQGYLTDSADGVPAGLALRQYYQFDNGFGPGIDIGPAMMFYGDVDFSNVPVSLTCRYTFNQFSSVAPYVRAGLSNNYASGDYVEDTRVGFFGALGMEFFKDSQVNMGVEAAYDSSEIEMEKYSLYRPMETENISPAEFTVSIFVIF